jgi:unsaturated chondroitin disaccharide hydrolase
MQIRALAIPLPSRTVTELMALAALWLAPAATGQGLRATNDSAYTLPNQAIAIPVLTNDWDTGTNGLALLQVSPPAHGKVSFNSSHTPPDAELASLFQFAAVQLSNSVVQVGNTNLFPKSTYTNGTWKTSGANDWTCGFFAGCLWYLYEQTGDPHFKTWAQNWTGSLRTVLFSPGIPDFGFMLYNSFGAGYRLTTNADYYSVVMQAANSVVANGYNPATGAVGRMWDANTFWTAIDWTMDLELLFRAAALSGNRSLYTNALTTAQRLMADNLRPDSSSYQCVWYNQATGAILRKGTYDGVSDESTWSRGQAWGAYGFTMVGRETGNPGFLYTAQRMADWFLTNVPPDQVPYWDFQAPGIPNAPKDSSTSAIMLSGLLELSQLATNAQDRARYWGAARRIFDSLRSTNYLAQGSRSSGLLLHGTGNPPQDWYPEVDCSLILGDYYFIEALRRYTDLYRRTSITYTPEPDFRGTDTFTYQVGNHTGECVTATVTVTVGLPEPRISFSRKAQTNIITFPSVPGRSYFVQYTTNLAAPQSWDLLATNLTNSGTSISITNANSGNRRFYRVGVAPAAPGQ